MFTERHTESKRRAMSRFRFSTIGDSAYSAYEVETFLEGEALQTVEVRAHFKDAVRFRK